jgi:glucose-1-phosphate cytidylyltransferase
MKVVLFCGGQGMRLRDYSELTPKPMVNIGYRPILWHVMKYYAHFGHRDFILCLGHKADVIKNYFRHYDETVSNDFVLSEGSKIELLNSDIDDWRITFVDTGISASIGQRLAAVEPYLEGEEVFLANYADGLTDLDLDRYLEDVLPTARLATFLCVRPTNTFHVVSALNEGLVTGIAPVSESDVWINAGYYVFRRAIFDSINEGEDLVTEPFARLIERGQLLAYRYTGFWMAMDTFKDKETLDSRYIRGDAPWEVWRRDGGNGGGTSTGLPDGTRTTVIERTDRA